MNARRSRILNLVARSYIDTAQPVASARIAEQLDLSSATVRNEFAALEAEGYLHQPHASAGRIPTAQGFRSYAARFLPPRPLTARARQRLLEQLRDAQGETLLEGVARATADLCGYAVVVSVAADDALHAHEIHLSLLSDRSVLAVVVLENGLVRQLRVPLDPAPSDSILDDAERNLRQLTLPLREVPAALQRLARGADGELARTLAAIALAWPEVVPDRSARAGLRGILNEPESRDPDFVRLVIEHIEAPAVPDHTASDRVWVHTDEALARVHATVRIGGAFGVLTVVGPARMRYDHALRVARGVTDAVGTGAAS